MVQFFSSCLVAKPTFMSLVCDSYLLEGEFTSAYGF